MRFLVILRIPLQDQQVHHEGNVEKYLPSMTKNIRYGENNMRKGEKHARKTRSREGKRAPRRVREREREKEKKINIMVK